MTKISYLLVSFNTKAEVQQCAAAIVECHPHDIEYEIIVVDNASTDGTAAQISRFQIPPLRQGFAGQADSKFKYIQNSENVGYGRANNQAYQEATGEYIFLLNPDTILKQGTVERLLSVLESEKDAGAVAPRLVFPDGSVQASCFQLPTIGGAVAEYVFGMEGAYSKYYPHVTRPTPVDAVVGAALLIPRSTIKGLGTLFDEKFFLYYEDMDLCRRIKQNRLKIYYVPDAEVVHQHGASTQKTGDWAYKQNQKSAKIYFGPVAYFFITQILKYGQKWQKILKRENG